MIKVRTHKRKTKGGVSVVRHHERMSSMKYRDPRQIIMDRIHKNKKPVTRSAKNLAARKAMDSAGMAYRNTVRPVSDIYKEYRAKLANKREPTPKELKRHSSLLTGALKKEYNNRNSDGVARAKKSGRRHAW